MRTNFLSITAESYETLSSVKSDLKRFTKMEKAIVDVWKAFLIVFGEACRDGIFEDPISIATLFRHALKSECKSLADYTITFWDENDMNQFLTLIPEGKVKRMLMNDLKTGDDISDEDKKNNVNKVIEAADKLGLPTKLKPGDILKGKKSNLKTNSIIHSKQTLIFFFNTFSSYIIYYVKRK